MAVILESNTQTEEELVQALEANGYERAKEEPKADESKPAVEEKKSELPEKPKEEKPAAEGDKIADDQESPDKDKSQEKPQEDKDKDQEDKEDKEVKGESDKPKSRGGWQKRLADLTRQRETLEDQVELERGSKASLQRQLDEVNSKLAELQPKDADKPAELARPKKPRLKDFDFDETKLEAAEEKYDADLDAYYKAVRDKELKDALTVERETQQKNDRERQVAQAQRAFEERRDKGKSDLPDYDELMAELPEDAVNLTGVVGTYIENEAENPAILIHFLMKDYLENDGAELGRIMKLNDFQKIKAIVKIEDRLLSERSKGTKEAPKADKEPEPKKEATEEKKPPAKETPKRETPEAPIIPVSGGSRATKGKDYHAQLQAAADAGDGKEYQRIRALMKQESQPAKV